MSRWLQFGFRRRLPQVLQTEAAECGLACMAMVAGFHGHQTDLAAMRRRFPGTLKGATLQVLMRTADDLGLNTRAVRLELEDLGKLRLPAILHWEFRHFVVLKAVRRRYIVILDPARGERRISWQEASKAFTGVALELWPGDSFQLQTTPPRIRLRELVGRVQGLPGALTQILLLALALEVFTLVSPLFLQWVIDHAIVAGDRDLLLVLALGFGLLMLLQHLISLARMWVLMVISTTLNLQWRSNVFSHLLRLPVGFFQRRHLGDVVSRFNSLDQIQNTLTTTFVTAFLDGLMAVVTLVVLFIYSPKLALISVAAVVLYAVIRACWYGPLRRATEEEIVHGAKQHSHFLESLRGITSIKLFQRFEARRSAWQNLLVDQTNARLKSEKLGIFYQLANGLLFGIENLWIIWLGAAMIIDGAFSVGMLMAFISYKTLFGNRVSELVDKYFEVRMLRLHAERLADIVLTEPEVASTRLLQSPARSVEPSVEIRNLAYRYSASEPFVLANLSFRVEAGESVAIVGPSGCGKSTLLNLLLGIAEPTHGEIHLGGLPLRSLGAHTMREMTATVLQDDQLFAGTLADNISFFDPQADQSRIEACAQLAGVHDLIAAMPMAYNTLIGDMGTVLSGGQKQLVLLARALYKRPSILLLDEATSHLDVELERVVSARVRALGMTRIMVAHRPETIASADRVIDLAAFSRDPVIGFESPADAYQAESASTN
jgi:ATP-binding cassette, subfamily B, bacterial CvaB/MchF/RaxB